MANLRTWRQEWDSQPQEVTPAARDGLAHGLVALFHMGQRVDVASMQVPATNSGIARVGLAGLGTDYAATTHTAFAHKDAYAQTGAFTILALLDVDTVTNYGGIISKQESTTKNCPFEFRIGAVDPTDSRLNLVRANGTEYSVWTGFGSDTVAAGDKSVVLGVSCADNLMASSSVRFYHNENAVAGTRTRTGSGITVADNGSALTIGKRSDAVVYLDGSVYLVALWNRQLSDAEVLAFRANPWQLFAPRRIIVPVDAAVATVPSLSSLTTTNITATTARLGLTLTF